MFQRGNKGRGPVFNNVFWVTVKGNYYRLTLFLYGVMPYALDDLLMSTVNAIEHSDGCDRVVNFPGQFLSAVNRFQRFPLPVHYLAFCDIPYLSVVNYQLLIEILCISPYFC